MTSLLKTALAALVLTAPGCQWLTGVRQHNAALAQALAAGQRGQWAAAAAAWQAAANAPRPAPALLLNLGQAQRRAGQDDAARRHYGELLKPGTPAALGSAARQQLAALAAADNPVLALGLLREALRVAPANAVARRNYERLQTWLATQTPPAAPPGGTPPPAPKAAPKPAPQPAPAPSGTAPAAPPQPGPTGQTPRPQPQNPDPTAPPQPAASRPQPGAGPPAPLPTGPGGGPQRGLDTDASAAPGTTPPRRPPPGREAAAPADVQLQTQAQRLQALNLTPAQARQLLETLRAQEQQYLQQVRRPAPATPKGAGGPTW